MVKGMVFRDGTEYLDRLLQKSYRYEHHLLNYQESKKSGLIPNGLRINKSPAIKPLSKDFNQRSDGTRSYIMLKKTLWNCYFMNPTKLSLKCKLI